MTSTSSLSTLCASLYGKIPQHVQIKKWWIANSLASSLLSLKSYKPITKRGNMVMPYIFRKLRPLRIRNCVKENSKIYSVGVGVNERHPPKIPPILGERGEGPKISTSKYHFRDKKWVFHTQPASLFDIRDHQKTPHLTLFGQIFLDFEPFLILRLLDKS